jgi:hypothetical protein
MIKETAMGLWERRLESRVEGATRGKKKKEKTDRSAIGCCLTDI